MDEIPELEGWGEIHRDAEKDKVRPSPGSAFTRAFEKVVSSVARSGLRIEELKGSLADIKKSINKLNENIKKADESSTKLAKALNHLTFWGVIIAGTGVFLSLIKFLYENKICLFAQ